MLSVVIPCYNEEEALGAVLKSIPDIVTEVIVVDNASTDNSRKIAEFHGAKVVIEPHKGYGAALHAGITQATGDMVAFFDGDGSYPVESLKECLATMQKNDWDFLSGCRFPLLNANPKVMPWPNRMANVLVSWWTRLLFGIKITDTQTGYMIFKRKIWPEIETKNTGMGFSQEIKIRAWLLNPSKCGEVHIYYHVRVGESKFNKLQDGPKNFKDLMALHSLLKKQGKILK
jgi:dolichol-phosphate hexosyltransferase